MEEHPIYGFARHYNPKLTDSEIKAKYIDNGKYLETMEMLRQDSYGDLDSDEFLTRFHTKYPDLSKKKEPTVSGASSSAGSSYSWDSGRPKLEGVVGPGKQTSLTGASSGVDLAASKRAEQELALQKARQRPDFEKAADLDDYTQQQVQGSILAPEKEYQARLNTLQSDSGNLQRAIEASEARIKEKWGDNWMEEYNARQQALNDPNYKYGKEEIIQRQQEFEADEFINDRNNFITALEANQSAGVQLLKDDKFAYARALEEYDKKRLQKAEHAGWGNLTLGILQRSAGKLVGSVGEVMNIGENLVTQDKTYGTWDKIEDFFIDFQDQTAKVAPRPTKYTRPLYTKTAKTTLNGEKVEVDYVDDKPAVVRNSQGMVIEADPTKLGDLKPKNQYNGKGLLYQTGEVLADAMVQIATTKGIGGTLVKTGMGAKVAYATGVTASTMGQMAGGLYDQGLKMFDGDKRKAAQYATMTGLAIGVGSNLFGVEARLAGGPGVFDNLTMGQVAKGLTPKAAAARTATNFFKQGAGEAFEETILEKGIEAASAMVLNGDAEDIDLNEMKGTALISFAVGALMGGAESDFKNSAWLVAAENPEEFKKALQAEVANGKKVDVEKMYNKALKIKGLSEIKEVREEDIPKLDELTDLKDKAEKAKAIGADAQAKVFKEQAEAKEVEIFKEQEEEIVIPEETPEKSATEGVRTYEQSVEASKSIAENILADKEITKSTNKPEYVPVDDIAKFVEVDRAADPRTAGNVDELSAQITKDGGIKEPVVLTVFKDRKAVITEGNHRVAAAKKLGVKSIPTRVEFSDKKSTDTGYSETAVKLPEADSYAALSGLEKKYPTSPVPRAITSPTSVGFINSRTLEDVAADPYENVIENEQIEANPAEAKQPVKKQTPRQTFESSLDQSIADLNISQEQADALKQTTSANAKNWAKRTGKTEEEFYEKFKPTVSRETTQIPDDALKQIVGEKADVPTARKNLQIAKRGEGKMTQKAIYLATGWEKVDGKWKYDLPDVKADQLEEGTYKLGDVATGGIIDAYPDAKDIEVVVDPNLKSLGMRQGNKITLRTGYDKSTLIHELQHWVQQKEGFARGSSPEAISEGNLSKIKEARDKFLAQNPNIKKALSDPNTELSEAEVEKLVENKKLLTESAEVLGEIFKKYEAVAGEVEARNAAKRSEMSPAERKLTPISETEDTKDKIFLDGKSVGKEELIGGEYAGDQDYLEIAKQMEEQGMSSERIFAATNWERGKDRKWRHEIGDIKISKNVKWDDFNSRFNKPLSEIIEPDSEVFKYYPELKKLVVNINNDKKQTASHAVYLSSDIAEMENGEPYIYANIPSESNKELAYILSHEIQHAIQDIEGFAVGGNEVSANGRENYLNLAGEVEARNVETRMDMTPREKQSIPFSKSEDTDRSLQEVIYLQQQKGQTLGAFSTIDGEASAWLFDGATVETLFHEIDPTTGHFGHAVMYDILDNALPEYRAQAEADVKTIEDFLGASDRNWTREQHEQFVAAGEKYLREGVAPTKELRPVFERLKTWLTDIFNSIKDRVDIDITHEVRAVFDRAMGGKPNTQMAAEAFKGSTDGVVFKNGFFGFKLKESFIRGVKMLWNYTFYRDGDLPDIASKLTQKRLGNIREQIKKADLSSERLREMLKGKSESQIRDINAALQNPNLGKQPLFYSDGTNIEEAILNESVEMRMHVDSLSSMLITEGIAVGESAMTILGNLEFYLTQDLTVDFNQDWDKLNGYADAKLGRLDTKIEESEGAEQTEFKIERLRVQAKKIQFHTANIEKAVREEEEKLRVAGKLPANQSPRRKDIGKAYETGVYKYSDGTDIEPGIIRDLKAMKEISKEIEKGIADLKLLGTLNMADMPMYLTRSYQVHWDKDWFDKVQKTEAFTNAVRFFREQKNKEKDDLIALVKFYREKLNSTDPGTDMIPSADNDQGMAEAASEFYRAKLAKAELELSEIDMFDPVAEAKASLHQQADKSGSFSSSASLGSSSAGSFAKRKLIPDEIRALWGESKDPILNYMTSVYKIAHILENRRFIREVVKQGEGKFLHPFPVGDFFAKFPTTSDELAEYHSTPEIVAAFKIYNQSITQSDPTNVFHRAIDALSYASGVVKKNLTVFSIASAARNFFYNPFAMIQRGAWNPLSKNVGDAIRYFYKGTEKETLEFYRLGILGDDLISGPLADIRKDYQRRTGEPVIPGPIGKSWLPRIKEELKKGTRAMEFAYAFGDNFYKVIDFYRQREKLAKLYKNKKYEDLLVSEQEEIKEMAAERILSEHASYSTLPRGMKILAKQPIIAPFASHPYEMIRNTKNMVVNLIKDMKHGSDFKENGLSVKQMELLKSGLGQIFIFAGVPAIAGIIRGAMSGMSDDDEEKLRYFLPIYHENSYIIPISNDKGKVHYLDISGVLPQGHILGTFNNINDSRFGPAERAENALAKFMQPFTSVDPLTKSMAESFLGYQVDSPERKISIKGEQEWLKTRIWNIAGKKGPGTLNSLMRIHEAMTNPRTDKITSNELMSLGLGVRVYNVDVVNNFGFAALEVADKLQDTFGEYDRMIRSKAFGLLSPAQQEAEKKKTIERETKDYYKFANEFRRVYLAAKTFPDIDERAVDQKMARLGLDRYVVQGIMTGDIKEPRFGK